ncbi:MAG TPA: hypothetical protein PKC55_10540 [Dysgonomonas sp.]|uniref:hypothetical protein n=1 Tax=unclassified Dysgonomonas TaxID=2630389 RepID=UPI0025C2816C|nr:MULTISPECIES: hypothetical protein [unclassified Dysgonomonas]HML65258.1 hypothetical protein [Dysgonomonas sp.]
MEKIKIDFSECVADNRKQIATLLMDAIKNLTEPYQDLMAAIRRISDYYEDETGYYPVISLSKDDMREVGFNPDELGPDDMRNFVDHMPLDSMMDSYWVALKDYAKDDYELPELHTEIDSLYDAYKKEHVKEPLYATIWLEDKGYNNLPWQDTVKLTLDEDEDEKIYMYFQGYADLKDWLYSTLREDSNSEDSWCYENPQHRIEFFDQLLLDD